MELHVRKTKDTWQTQKLGEVSEMGHVWKHLDFGLVQSKGERNSIISNHLVSGVLLCPFQEMNMEGKVSQSFFISCVCDAILPCVCMADILAMSTGGQLMLV